MQNTRPRCATGVKHRKLRTWLNPQADPLNPTPTLDGDFIPGPKLRAKLGISAVTLWRWRHDKEAGFPAPKVINGRLYFPVGAVMAWLAKQPCQPETHRLFNLRRVR
jgi:predicted DNA-binding transcriptional regulator AlpA